MFLLRKIIRGLTVGQLERKMGTPGLFRNVSGRDTRSDKFFRNVIRDNVRR